jgi:lysine-specific demethylase/histidyl-hydroxylase NO66
MSAVDDDATVRWLVGDLDQFVHHHWGRAPMRRTAQPGFAHLLDVASIDRWLAGGARRPNFRVVRAGATIDESSYTRTVRIGGRDVRDVADPDAIAALFARGSTLVMQNLEFEFPPLRTFVDAVQRSMSHPIQANAYLTPPGAAGLNRHADTHDVLVLQVAGTKCWNVEGLGELTVGPGDVVYIPRGAHHSARTSVDTSLHLTLGILGVTTRQVLRRMLAAMDDADEPLDRTLPLGFARMTPTELAVVIGGRVGQVAARVTAADFHAVATTEMLRVRPRPDPQRSAALTGAIQQMTITQDSRLRRIADCWLHEDGDRVVVNSGDRQVSFPAAAQAALDAVCQHDELKVDQLVGLDESSRLVVARRLIREGLIEAVSPEPASG